MKELIMLLITLCVIPVSIFTMIYGWGLTPQNWGWIAFGYLWILIPGIVSAVMTK
ncbi:hypothetical protein [Sphingomonas sp.]|jgi:hypothetical protein|uniref:hypothetical protein n=1 Tax=Sphingomonas sp. TaxID=28214 RepID=UPI00356A00BB